MEIDREELTQISFLFYLKIKTAVALIIIKSAPLNVDILEYVYKLQLKFRKKATKCNLYLEKRIFHDRLLILLPALKIYSTNSGCFMEPMDVDENESQILNEKSPFLNQYIPNNEFIVSNAKYYGFIYKLRSYCQFLEAVIAIESMCNSEKQITRSDICRIISKIKDTPIKFTAEIENEKNQSVFISPDLLKYFIGSEQIKRVIVQVLSSIIEQMSAYFCQPIRSIFQAEGLSCILSANKLLLKCIKRYSYLNTCTDKISEFIKETLETIVLHNGESLNDYICQDWYAIFGIWKVSEKVCAEMIESLIKILKVISQSPMKSIIFVVTNLKRLLIAYSSIHRKIKESHLKKTNLKLVNMMQLERILIDLIVQSMPLNKLVVRTSWTCLKVIISLKSTIN